MTTALNIEIIFEFCVRTNAYAYIKKTFCEQFLITEPKAGQRRSIKNH